MEFNLIHLQVTVETDRPVHLCRWLPGAGSLFAAACSDVCCSRRGTDCGSCDTAESCGWDAVFSRRLATDLAAVKRHQKPPLPFAFQFPTTTEDRTGARYSFRLVVIGSAIAQLALLLAGLTELVQHPECPAPGRIVAVESRDYQGVTVPVGQGFENLVVLSGEGILDSRLRETDEVVIRFGTPLMLVENGRRVRQFDFGRFARSVMRRVSSMAYYYADHDFGCDYKALSRHADAVDCLEAAFSTSSSAGGKGWGIIGQGRFCGEIRGLLPFLVLGSYLGVGKGAAFGMGSYEIL